MESIISIMTNMRNCEWTTAMPAVNTNADQNTADLRALRQLVQKGSVKLIGKSGQAVPVPASIVALLAEITRNMEAGKSVSVVAEHHELTTQRAANMLGVSRPFFVQLLEEGKLPFHRTGSHRRVYLGDLLAFKDKRDRARHEALAAGIDKMRFYDLRHTHA